MEKEKYIVPAPKEISFEQMREEQSVLGGISLLQDFNLIIFIVDRLAYCNPEKNIQSIHKIFRVVRTKEWQNKYDPVIAQMFKMYIEIQSPEFLQVEKGRLQLAFACMILDGYLYPAEFPKRKERKDALKKIIKKIFKEYYGKFGVSMNGGAINTIIDIRNAVTHRGGLANLYDALKFSQEDLKKMCHSSLSPDQFVDYFVAEFNYLFEDIILRVLGLEQESDLAWNLRPAWNSNYWK